MQERQYNPMDRRVRRREALRLVLGAVGFVLAILIGFALGLRVGDRRNNPTKGTGSDSTAFLAAIPDTSGAAAGLFAAGGAAGANGVAGVAEVAGVAGVAGADSAAVTQQLRDSLDASQKESQEKPLKGKMAEIARKEAARGAEYLTTHNRWNREEMEKISALQGLWDAVNTYDLEEIRRYNEVFDCPPLATIIEGLERTHKQGYYASKKDQIITLSTYIKRLR